MMFGVLTPYTNVLLHRISEDLTPPYSKLRYLCDDTKNIVISGFRREVAENCALLGSYAANSGNLLQTFRDSL